VARADGEINCKREAMCFSWCRIVQLRIKQMDILVIEIELGNAIKRIT